MIRIAPVPRFAACALVLAACAPRPPTPPGPRPDDEPVPPPTVASEFQDTHHARIEGIVVNARGEPLEAVEVVTWELVDRARGSVAQHRARSGPDGRFVVSVGLITSGAPGDTMTLEMNVRATAMDPRHPRLPDDRYHAGEAVVSVRVVPRDQPPPVTRGARIVVPIP